MDKYGGLVAGTCLRTLAKNLRARHLGLAFLMACVLLTFRSSALLCDCIDTEPFATLVVMAGLACQSLAMISIAALSARDPGLVDRLPAWPFVGATLAGLAVMSLVGHVGPEGSQAASVAGSVSAGVGYGYLCGMWAQAYGRMHPARTSFYLPLSILLAFALYFAVTAAGEAMGVQATLLMLPLPLISLWCLRANKDDVDARDEAGAQDDAALAYYGAFRSLWRLVLGAAIFAFMYGFVWQLAVAAVGSVNVAHRLPLAVSFAVGLGFAALVVFGRRRIDLSVVYGLTAPAFIVAFALLPAFWSRNPIGLYSAVSAGFGVFDIVIWCMVAEAAYDYRVSGFVVSGAVRGATILAQLLGIVLGYLFSALPDRPPLLIVAVSVVAVYFVALWLVMALKRREGEAGRAGRALVPLAEAAGPDDVAGASRGAPAPTAPAAPEPEEAAEAAFAARVERVAAHYRLTRRESEVLPYLARGRSAKVIAEALFVSENTVRSHISRILDKTDLHSKQELIDLVESF